MKIAIGAGVGLSIVTTFLMLIPVSIGANPLGDRLMLGSLVLAPGYLGYGYLRETFVGPLNVHLDVGECIFGGFLLNTLIWILICKGLRSALAWRARRRPAA